jgi:serine/threonine protein kinase
MPLNILRQQPVSHSDATYTRKPAPKPTKLGNNGIPVERVLGGGAFGRVYKVRGQNLAAKQMAKKHKNLSGVAEREATALSALKHPNIVAFNGFHEGPGAFVVTMELCTGGNLKPLVTAGGAPEAEVKPYLRQITDAVAFCHDNGVVHRDIKPDNFVFADPTKKTVKLIDFGMCEILPPSGNKALKGQFGTVGYMAPEILSGKDPYDGFKADAFSVGVVFLGLVKGCGGGRIMKGGWTQQPTLVGASPELLTVLKRLLHGLPNGRKTVSEVKTYPYFAPEPEIPAETPKAVDQGTQTDDLPTYPKPASKYLDQATQTEDQATQIDARAAALSI